MLGGGTMNQKGFHSKPQWLVPRYLFSIWHEKLMSVKFLHQGTGCSDTQLDQRLTEYRAVQPATGPWHSAPNLHSVFPRIRYCQISSMRGNFSSAIIYLTALSIRCFQEFISLVLSYDVCLLTDAETRRLCHLHSTSGRPDSVDQVLNPLELQKQSKGTQNNCRWKDGFCYFSIATYLLTPWSTVLQKLTGFQIVKKFPTFYGTRRFITAFTSACHLSLSSASSIHPYVYPYSTSWRSILILSSHLHLSLPSGLFPQVSPPKFCISLSSPAIRATCPVHLILLDFDHPNKTGLGVQIIKN